MAHHETVLLTAEEETALARQVQYGTAREAQIARDELVLHNLGLVGRAIAEYEWLNLRSDLSQAGFLGLVEAANKFDPDRNIRFSSFAYHWITREIRVVLRGIQMVRPPGYFRNKGYRLPAREKARRKQDIHRAQAAEAFKPHVHIPLSDTETAAVAQPPDHHPGAEQAMEQAEEATALHQALESLSPLEHDVIERRFGIGFHPPATYRQVSAQLGLSEARIKATEAAAMVQLRAIFCASTSDPCPRQDGCCGTKRVDHPRAS